MKDRKGRSYKSPNSHLQQENAGKGAAALPISRRLLQPFKVCNAFLVNITSMKLATEFVLSRILKVNYKETLNESSIAMLHSPLFERNVGKSLTLNILAKAEKMPSRRHPTMLARGDQSQSGTSV
ncbi:hypothetical protein P5673_028513 [Acropora cervicornis]|uniref:Uncharacterized protein n=1 Tax=Acropora cervicornis TaxID=6130 RepID=A0AAD9UUQ3_ACRCE|nr:hypothetical protein P5673_028513 [Acropora cervicornis]